MSDPEAALRQSERVAQARLAELEATYATAPVGLCVIDTDLRFVRVNERLAEINGLPAAAHLGRTVREVVPGVADEVEPVLRRILETGEPVIDYELTGETASQPGVARTWIESWYPLWDDRGRVIGINVVADEVTAQKRAEAELRESEERYRTLFESIDEGFCVLEMVFGADGAPVDYRFLETNPAFERQTGLLDAVGKTARELVPDLEGHWFETYGRVARTGVRERFVEESAAMGRWFEVEAFRVGGAARHRVALLFTDITARRRSEAALRESEAHLRRVIDNMIGFVGVTDAEGTLLDANRAVLEVVGGGRADVVGRPFWEGEWWGGSRATAARIRDAVRRGARGETARFDVDVRTAGGDEMVVDFMLTPVQDAAGAVLYLIPSGVDVTSRKRAEEAVARLNETLEDRVEKRTDQVRRLVAQLSVAEQEERERIAHVLHDDIQQQLYGLSLLLGVLHTASGPESARILERAESILDGAITQTRTLAAEFSPSVLDSERLEDTLLWLADRLRQQYGLDVEVRVDRPCIVTGATTRLLLYQALREVLFNVVKHAGVGRASVTVEGCDGEVRLVVEDGGHGFDPGAGAAGFGLSTVRERLVLAGARFEVDSAPGRGTRVRISVPPPQPIP